MDPLRSIHVASPAKRVGSIHEFILHDDDDDGKDLDSLTDSSLSSSQCSTCVNAEATLHRCEALAHENKLLHANAVIAESTNETLSEKIDELKENIEAMKGKAEQHQTHFAELAEKCVILGLEKAGQEEQIMRLSTGLRDASRTHDAEVDELKMHLQQEREVGWPMFVLFSAT